MHRNRLEIDEPVGVSELVVQRVRYSRRSREEPVYVLLSIDLGKLDVEELKAMDVCGNNEAMCYSVSILVARGRLLRPFGR
jgi:hypothetical protein